MQEDLNIIELDNILMANGTFEATIKKWGSSVGVVIPKEIMKEQELKEGQKVTLMVLQTDMRRIKKLFGTVKFGKSTDEILAEDDGWDHDW